MFKQTGSTLIMTLIILILVTLVGTIAIKSGILGLRLATNSQIQTLLLENSNAALFNIENPAQVRRQSAGDGMFNYFNSIANSEDELVFCYRASESAFFAMNKASAISSSGSISKIGPSGFCKSNQFAGGRSAVLSQIYMSKNIDVSLPFAHVPKGTSGGSSALPVVSNNISVTVISVLPGFAGASKKEIEDCFKKRALKVSACFSDLDIPFNTQHADYIVGAQPKLVS